MSDEHPEAAVLIHNLPIADDHIEFLAYGLVD